jgi:hypothetical protein
MSIQLGPVWIQNIFKVLGEYYGLAKYFSFGNQGDVWMQQTLWV